MNSRLALLPLEFKQQIFCICLMLELPNLPGKFSWRVNYSEHELPSTVAVEHDVFPTATSSSHAEISPPSVEKRLKWRNVVLVCKINLHVCEYPLSFQAT
jgi:hypothetical protein